MKPKFWTVRDITDGRYLGPIEIQDKHGEYHTFELVETSKEIVFGGCTNTGLLQSGYINKDNHGTNEAISRLISELEVFYNDGREYCTEIVCNERM